MYQTSPKSQADLKFHNLKLVFDLVKREGPISRASLAKRTGLSPTSMTRIVNVLKRIGLISEHSVAQAGVAGRPSTLLEICADAAYCLCVDAMPNVSKVTLVDMATKQAVYRELVTVSGTSFETVADELNAMLGEMCRDAGITRDRIACCGMSISGHVLRNGYIAASSQMQWADIDGVGILERALDMPAIVENDCKAALLGEQYLLSCAGESTANIAYVKFGWAGVGSAAMVDGMLLRGSRNAAGEIGHFNSQLEGLSGDKCEFKGCFEHTISESAVIEHARSINPACASLAGVNEAIANGDERIIKLMNDICEYIAIAVSDISCAYNSDRIILSGNIITNLADCYQNVLRYVERRLTRSVQPNLQVCLSKMGTNASLYGMSCLAVEETIKRLLSNDTGF